MGGVRKFKERSCPLFLFLLSLLELDRPYERNDYVQIQHGNVYEVEKFTMIFDGLTT